MSAPTVPTDPFPPPAERRSPLRRLDDLLVGPEAPARLLAVQGLFLLLISVRTVLSPYPKLAGAPAALFKPAWAVSWLDAMPPRWVIILVQVGIVAATTVTAAVGAPMPSVVEVDCAVNASAAFA